MKSKIHKYYPRWQDGIAAARQYLKNNSKRYTILVEQNRNMGDTLHLTPIIRHFRNEHPNAVIAFVVAQPYANAHEFNPHIDALFLVPKLEPTYRIQLRRKIIEWKEIKTICAPSIFPYGAVWKSLSWSHANIADQYFHNAGIKQLNGGRKLVVEVTPEDVQFAKSFISKHKLNPKRTVALEYNSYSARPKWNYAQFSSFVGQLKGSGIKCISIAGKGEKQIAGSIPAMGITWRQSVALLNEIGGFVGSGSGITMLAAAAKNPPEIFEVAIPDSVSMKGCQYAPSIILPANNIVGSAKLIATRIHSKK